MQGSEEYATGQSQPVRNRLLCSIAPEAFNSLRPHLRRVILKRRQILQEAYQPTEKVSFIERGVASTFARTQRDGAVEVGITGRFGFVGLPVVFGTASTPHRCLMQVAGEALQIDAKDLTEAMDRHPIIRLHLLRHVHALLIQYSQNVLCNARHDLTARLCRWLLLAHSRLDDDIIPLTHDSLSMNLGVRRASVSTALSELHDWGAIRKTRGTIAILERRILEQRTCECHRIIEAAYRRITVSGVYGHIIG